MEYLLTKYLIYKQLGGNKIRWTTFHHNGVMFPPEYIAHKTPLIYDGREIILNEIAEEYATIYSKYTDTQYMDNKTFKKNFWKDWKKLLNDPTITNFDLCDFSLIYDYHLKDVERKKNISKEEKEILKKQKDEEEEKYKYAYIDGKKEFVGNFHVEIPNLYFGRGNNPQIGRIKRRLYPENFILNLSKDAPIPELPDFLKNHKWGGIVHIRNSYWIASWKDDITDKMKYVWLSEKSEIKSKSDEEKFEKARKLKKKIKHIREVNNENLKSGDIVKRQIATALYFIDNFALRVGNEKGEMEADTVGTTTLKVENIDLKENNKINLDFIGKDSIRYINTFTVDKIVYDNIKEFIENKDKSDKVFDKINSDDVNKYLQSFIKGLMPKRLEL